MRHFSKCANRRIVILSVFIGSVGAMGAAVNHYWNAAQEISDQILARASQLKSLSHDPVLNSHEIEGILGELKGLIDDYEENMLFAESPYPGELLLGRTPPGHSTWLETLCDGRYGGMVQEIRIRRVGRWPSYIRINDIEITYSTLQGQMKETFNANGGVKLHSGDVFRLALSRPMRISRVRIRIDHASSGLQIYGIPYQMVGRHIPHHTGPAVEETCPEKVLLGTTPPGDSTWLDTLCSSHCGQPLKEITLKRTGRQASYLRINDIEITYMTPYGPRKEVFNEGGRVKLYYGGEFRLALPRPMRVTRVRVNINHESTGLEVYGVHL